MEERDHDLKQKVRGIIAVVTPDIDAVMCDVEDGIAYIEGVVPTDLQRKQISAAVCRLQGLTHVIICLSTERIIKSTGEHSRPLAAAPVMRYHSLS